MKLLKQKKSSHSIALGFAIGTFIGIIPTPGISIILGLLIVLIYRKVNKYSLFIAILFWNTLALAPMYYLSYKIGDLLFGDLPLFEYNVPILNQIYNFTKRYLRGNFILAVSVSIASYFIVKKMMDELKVHHIIKESAENHK